MNGNEPSNAERPLETFSRHGAGRPVRADSYPARGFLGFANALRRRNRFAGDSRFTLAGTQACRGLLSEDHYGGHTDCACGRVGACERNHRGLGGNVRCRNGARGLELRPAGHRALRGTHCACGRSHFLSGCAPKILRERSGDSTMTINRGQGRRESLRRTLA